MKILTVKLVYLVLGALILLTPQLALATEYSSTSFKVRDPDINIGGQQNTSSPLPAPGAPTLTATTGGSLAAATYFYKITALDSFGETQGGAENSVIVGGVNNAVAVSWTAVTGASSYRIYRGTATGAENTYYTSATASFSDTGTVGTAGTPPVTNTTGFKGAGTTGQSVTGQSTSTSYVVKAGFQYFDQTNPVPTGVNCAGNAVPICDGATFGVQTTTTSSADTLSANWSNNGTTVLFSDPESGIFAYDYSIKRLSDNKYWSGTAWDIPMVRFNTPALTVSVTGLQLQAGVSYSFVLRAVDGAGLYTADFTSPGILVLPALTFNISGVGTGQVIKSGVTTTTATADGLTLNFGTVVRNTSRIAAHDLTISTNSSQGYYVTVRVDRQLTCDACAGAPTIPSFPGTNANPLAWGSSNGLGYTTNNRKSLTDLSLSPTNRFSVSDIWSGFQTISSSNEVSYNLGPETATTRVGYQLRVDNNQLDGSYTNKIIYIATATY